MDHIKAISAIQDASMDMHMNLSTHLPDGRQVLTFIRPGNEPGRLLQLVNELPWDHNTDKYLPLSRVQVFTSKDESLSMSIFVYGEEMPSEPIAVDVMGSRILDYAQEVQRGKYLHDHRAPKPSDLFTKENLLEYMQSCSETYLLRSDPRRFLKQRLLYDQVSGTEGMAISIEESLTNDTGTYWIDIAVTNSLPQVTLENCARLLKLHNFDVLRSHLDVVADGNNGNVTLLRMVVSPLAGTSRHRERFQESPVRAKACQMA